MDDTHLTVYAVSTQPATEPPTRVISGAHSPFNDLTAEEPYAGFNTQIQQILSEADALHNEVERQGLKEVLQKYKDSFAKDSLDCGLTNIHTVRIPTNPNAPPTFVRQYKIPIASYEPVQEIVDSMLEKGVIRPCNSTYSAPIWPVLKPNGKWRPTIDYRKLNQQVPLSRWPMTQLDQEIPKIKGSTILSTLDVASGFWTIPVHPDDQHKLAFTFGNRQYTFTRCPFGYANSPAEFNIFLNKACPDARVRGNLVYVDDVLMKSSSVEDHLKEIDHVLNQLTTAGAKIALHKGQWCKTKVKYVGLLVGRNGIEPQSNRAQAIQSIKTPTNVSELRSFLGVCNYSRQFIENYADIARPLNSLLKKDESFVWTKAQDTAMSQLKQCLRSAPCLAYPDPGKEFYLDAGFSDQCLSVGLYQLHDKDKRVVAYASKTLLPPECKYSHCEKALLCTVWGIQRFSNYIGAQKVIIETCHQPVTFLNSQRIRDGVVTNARIATWLMTLQGRDVEARYAQNYKSSLGNGLVACQNCSTDTLDTSAEPKELPRPQATNHRYFEENVCTGMPTAYVDGCSYNREGKLQAGAGVVWLNNDPCPPQQLKLGPQSSQYAEIAAILITLQLAATHKIREHILSCTPVYLIHARPPELSSLIYYPVHLCILYMLVLQNYPLSYIILCTCVSYTCSCSRIILSHILSCAPVYLIHARPPELSSLIYYPVHLCILHMLVLQNYPLSYIILCTCVSYTCSCSRIILSHILSCAPVYLTHARAPELSSLIYYPVHLCILHMLVLQNYPLSYIILCTCVSYTCSCSRIILSHILSCAPVYLIHARAPELSSLIYYPVHLCILHMLVLQNYPLSYIILCTCVSYTCSCCRIILSHILSCAPVYLTHARAPELSSLIYYPVHLCILHMLVLQNYPLSYIILCTCVSYTCSFSRIILSRGFRRYQTSTIDQ